MRENIGDTWLLVVNREMATELELWNASNAWLIVLFMIITGFVLIYTINKYTDIDNIKKNWGNDRCNPMIMPFASIFGYNTKENFEFCMGKTFNNFSMPFFGSIGTMFSQFTTLLTMIFDSISSLRTTVASLGGGINVVFQEFTDRISNFFFRLRVSAIHIKSLIGRMYAVLFSVMYMGMSGITGMSSFTNTFLFSFLNVFCFPKDTNIDVKGKGLIPIKDIKIGDVLLPTNSRVTATFCLFSKGQPMVKLGNITVSTNHYVMYIGKPIMAGDHPYAIKIPAWDSDEPLYCLNTSNNRIPVDNFVFLDYDETTDGDKDTMNFIEGRLNSTTVNKDYKFKEYCTAIGENTVIKTTTGNKLAKDVKIGDKLVTGSEVVGLIRREVNEVCYLGQSAFKMPIGRRPLSHLKAQIVGPTNCPFQMTSGLNNGTIITPATLYWNPELNKWERFGEKFDIIGTCVELISFIVLPNSQIELEDGLRIRDYMELCSPDSEIHYSKHLET